MSKVTDFAKKQVGNALDKSIERRDRAAQLAQYCSAHYDELARLFPGTPISSSEIFGEMVENSELKKIVAKLDKEDGCAFWDTAKGRVWMFVQDERFSSQIFIKGCTPKTSSYNPEVTSHQTGYDSSHMQEVSFNEDGFSGTVQIDTETINKYVEANAFEAKNKVSKLKEIEERPIPSGEELKTEINDCTINANETRDEISRVWRARAIKLISRIKMPEASDFEYLIKEIERNINNCNNWDIEKAWKQKKEEIVDYAKDHYSDHPSVKPYFDAIENDKNKTKRHNKNVKNKRLIAWGIWLVATIVVFAISEEWYHYLFSGLGSIVLAIVAGILSLFVWEKKDDDD